MSSEIKNLLEVISAQQAVLYKKLDNIECKLNNSSRLAFIETYAKELRKEAEKLIIR